MGRGRAWARRSRSRAMPACTSAARNSAVRCSRARRSAYTCAGRGAQRGSQRRGTGGGGGQAGREWLQGRGAGRGEHLLHLGVHVLGARRVVGRDLEAVQHLRFFGLHYLEEGRACVEGRDARVLANACCQHVG